MDAKTNGAMPMSPVECMWTGDGVPVNGVQTGNSTGWTMGLTKREAFAMAAMQAVIAKNPPCGQRHGTEGCDKPHLYSAIAVEYADALLAALPQESQA